MAQRLITLDEWRLTRDLGHKELGQLIGCKSRTAYLYCCDPAAKAFRMPRPNAMRRIYVATGGEVRPDSFYKLPKLVVSGADPNQAKLPLENAA